MLPWAVFVPAEMGARGGPVVDYVVKGEEKANRYTVKTGFPVTHSKQTTVVLSNRYKKPPPGGVTRCQTEG
jgi:hypothetical protein